MSKFNGKSFESVKKRSKRHENFVNLFKIASKLIRNGQNTMKSVETLVKIA